MNNLQADIDSLYLAHQQTLVNSLRGMVGCHQTAEDLVQEAYLKVSGAAKNQMIEFPQPFLHRTAKNLALDYLGKQKVRDKKLVEQGDVGIQQIVDNAPTPDRVMQANQELRTLLIILEGQSERHREILILNKIYSWKYAEIAEHFGISKSALEKNIRIAMAHCLSAKLANQQGRS